MSSSTARQIENPIFQLASWRSRYEVCDRTPLPRWLACEDGPEIVAGRQIVEAISGYSDPGIEPISLGRSFRKRL